MKNIIFKIGDTVEMNPSSRLAYQAKGKNGKLVTGRIVNNINAGDLNYTVKWENEYFNSYGNEDLLPLKIDYEIY